MDRELESGAVERVHVDGKVCYVAMRNGPLYCLSAEQLGPLISALEEARDKLSPGAAVAEINDALVDGTLCIAESGVAKRCRVAAIPSQRIVMDESRFTREYMCEPIPADRGFDVQARIEGDILHVSTALPPPAHRRGDAQITMFTPQSVFPTLRNFFSPLRVQASDVLDSETYGRLIENLYQAIHRISDRHEEGPQIPPDILHDRRRAAERSRDVLRVLPEDMIGAMRAYYMGEDLDDRARNALEFPAEHADE